MACADCCGKTFLVILNVFVFILGVLFLGGGLYLNFGSSTILGLLDPMLQSATKQASAAGVSVGSTADLVSTLSIAAYVLIALGSFSLVVALFGCIGACCSVKVCLGIYTAIVLLMLIAKIVMIALLVTKTFDSQMFPAMVKDLEEKYEGPTAFNTESLLLNALMVQLQCCGIQNYTEFQAAVNWNRTLTYTYSGVSYTAVQVIPLTCCKVTGSFPDITPNDSNCTLTPTAVNSNMYQNCQNAVQSQIDAYQGYVYGVYAALLVFELICALVAICLIVRMDNKRNQVHPETSTPASRKPDKY